LRKELILLTEDVESKRVTTVGAIKQTNLKNLFIYVSGNNSRSTDLDEIALAITVALSE
jgi:hypothetical protein